MDCCLLTTSRGGVQTTTPWRVTVLLPAKTSVWFKPQDGKTLIFLPNKPPSTSKPWEYIHNPIIPTAVPKSGSFTVFQLALVSASPSNTFFFLVSLYMFIKCKPKPWELKITPWPTHTCSADLLAGRAVCIVVRARALEFELTESHHFTNTPWSY